MNWFSLGCPLTPAPHRPARQGDRAASTPVVSCVHVYFTYLGEDLAAGVAGMHNAFEKVLVDRDAPVPDPRRRHTTNVLSEQEQNGSCSDTLLRLISSSSDALRFSLFCV